MKAQKLNYQLQLVCVETFISLEKLIVQILNHG